MEPKAGTMLEKNGTPKGNNGYAEADSLSSTLKNPKGKNIYYYHLICAWVDYQTLFNSAPTEYAKCYLDISIDALEVMLSFGGKYSMSIIQKRAEYILRSAVKTLVTQSAKEQERLLFLKALGESEYNWHYTVPDFLMDADKNNLWAFCRVYSASEIVKTLNREVAAWDRKGKLNVNIDHAVGIQSELPPLNLQITYDSKRGKFVLERFAKITVAPKKDFVMKGFVRITTS